MEVDFSTLSTFINPLCELQFTLKFHIRNIEPTVVIFLQYFKYNTEILYLKTFSMQGEINKYKISISTADRFTARIKLNPSIFDIALKYVRPFPE